MEDRPTPNPQTGVLCSVELCRCSERWQLEGIWINPIQKGSTQGSRAIFGAPRHGPITELLLSACVHLTHQARARACGTALRGAAWLTFREQKKVGF